MKYVSRTERTYLQLLEADIERELAAKRIKSPPVEKYWQPSTPRVPQNKQQSANGLRAVVIPLAAPVKWGGRTTNRFILLGPNRSKGRQEWAAFHRGNPVRQCAYCHRMLTSRDSTVDHYLPLACGGRELAGNYRWACAACNMAKGHHVPKDFASVRRLLSVCLHPDSKYRRRRDLPWFIV